jgi:hypothetical protein
MLSALNVGPNTNPSRIEPKTGRNECRRCSKFTE